jgi:type IV pilus assembly protein PilE
MMRADGFTLIELVTVLLVTAVLAAIAYPSYQQVVNKARRAEAKAAMMKLMQQQERYYSQHGSYVAFSSASTEAEARRFKWYSGERPETSYYEISGEACAGEGLRSCLEITARPGTERVSAAARNESCGDLSLTSNGLRKASGSGAHCWN